tara:strand:+ start:19289 stop:19420 length:132 start_codon:yes stop_codon:yes gene_type:complete
MLDNRKNKDGKNKRLILKLFGCPYRIANLQQCAGGFKMVSSEK